MVSLHEAGGGEGLAEQEESGHDVVYGATVTQHSATLNYDTTSANNPVSNPESTFTLFFSEGFLTIAVQQGGRGCWK